MSVAMHEDGEPSLDEILASIRRIISEEGPAIAAPALEPIRSQPVADNVLVLTRRAPPRTPDVAAADPVPSRYPRPAWMDPTPAEPAPTETLHPEPFHPEPLHADPVRQEIDAAPPPVAPHAEIAPAPLPAADAWSAMHEEEIEPVAEPMEPDLEAWEAPAAPERPITPHHMSAETHDEEDAIVSPETEAATGDAFDRLARRVEPETHESPLMPPPGRTLEDVVRELLRPLIKEWLDENLPGMVHARIDEEIERISRRRVR